MSPTLQLAWLISIASLLAVSRSDEWRCNKVASLVNAFYDASLESPYMLMVLADLEESLGYSLDQPEHRRDLACQIVEVAPDMTALSDTLGVPYFKLYHYQKMIETWYLIEKDLDWQSMVYRLSGRALLLKRLNAWVEDSGFPNLPIEQSQADIALFIKRLQNDFGTHVKDSLYGEYRILFAHTPQEFALALVESRDQEELAYRLETSNWVLDTSTWEFPSRGSFMLDIGDAVTLGVSLEILPLQSDGVPELPQAPAACADIYQLLQDYLGFEREVDPYGSAPGRMWAEQQLSLDLLNPDVLLAVACDLSDIYGLKALAAYIRMPLHVVNDAREAALGWLTTSWGGLEGLRRQGQILEEVVVFIDSSGFPNFPLSVTYEDTTAVVQASSEVDYVDAFPTKHASPSQIVEALMSADTLQDYIASLRQLGALPTDDLQGGRTIYEHLAYDVVPRIKKTNWALRMMIGAIDIAIAHELIEAGSL